MSNLFDMNGNQLRKLVKAKGMLDTLDLTQSDKTGRFSTLIH